jgi:hypothetical protein
LAENQSIGMLENFCLCGFVMFFVMGFLNAKIVYRQPLRWVGQGSERGKGKTPLVFLGYSLCPIHWQHRGFK